MADESTDIASKEEMSICAQWIEGCRVVEHLLGILRAGKVDAKSLAEYLLDFLWNKGIDIKLLRGLGYDGASTMSCASLEFSYKSDYMLQVLCTSTAVATNYNWLQSMQQMSTLK